MGGAGSRAARRRRRQRGCGSSSGASLPQAMHTCQVAGRSVSNLIVVPPVSSTIRAPARSTRPTARRSTVPATGRPQPSPRPMRRRGLAPRASANAVGPLPEIELPSAPACERCGLRLGEARKQAGARGLRDAVVDRAAEQGVVARCASAATIAPTCAAWCSGESRGRPRAGSTARASAVRISLIGAHQHDVQLVGHRQPDDVQRFHRTGSARSRRGATARCCPGADPRRPLPPSRHGVEQRHRVEWRAEQRVHRDGARHGRGRAATLAA